MAFGTASALIGGAGLNVIGGAVQAGAAGRAARRQADAARYASDLQYQMYQQQRADQEPWRAAGISALSGMQDQDFKRDFTRADFQQDPGYEFRMAEGQRALERSAAARGGLQSGGTLRALTRYGQDFASNEFQNAYNRFNADRDRRFNRLASLSGAGQTATQALGQAGMNYANQVGANAMGAANAQGAADIARGNAWGGALSGIANLGVQGAAMASGGGGGGNWMQQWSQNQGAGAPSQPLYAGGRSFGLWGRS